MPIVRRNRLGRAPERLEDRRCLSANTFVSNPINCCNEQESAPPIIADLDSDGDLDVVSVGRDGIHYYENDQSNYSIGKQLVLRDDISAFAVGDLNGDGLQDLVVAERGELVWYPNQQQEFRARVSLSTEPSFARKILATDFDRDGDVDVLVSRFDGLSFLRNDGSAEFEKIDLSLSDAIDDFSVADVNHDGQLDLLLADRNGPSLMWYEMNHSDSNFVIHEIAATHGTLRAGDRDGDGNVELLLVDATERQTVWLVRDADSGRFATELETAHSILSTFPRPELVDLNGDGFDDLVTATGSEFQWEASDGAGGFENAQTITSRLSGAPYIAFGDLDGDSTTDVLEKGTQALQSTLRIIPNVGGAGSFHVEPTVLYTSTLTSSTQLADLDGDGDNDLLAESIGVGNNDGFHLGWYENIAEGRFGRYRPISSFTRFHIADDLDQDGDIDLVVSTNTALGWLANDGNGNFEPLVSISSIENTGLNGVYLTNVDDDGVLDLLLVMRNHVSWLPGSETFRFDAPELIGDLNRGQVLRPHDVDHDGLTDLVVMAADSNTFHWRRNLGGGTFDESSLLFSVDIRGGELGRSLEFADINQDGTDDMIIGGGWRVGPSWFAGTATGFHSTLNPIDRSSANAIIVIDMDGDGDQDVVSTALREAVLHENVGGGDFVATVIRDNLATGSSVSVGNILQDERQEVVIAGFTSGDLNWLSNRRIGDSNDDGRFDSQDLLQVFEAGEFEDGIASNSTFAEGDWNGDGEFSTADLVYAFQCGGFED